MPQLDIIIGVDPVISIDGSTMSVAVPEIVNVDNDPYRNDPSGGLDSALSAERPSRQHDQNQGPKPSRGGFVDVDDMKVEKVEMAFDAVEVPVQPPKKKRKKKKLL